MTDLVSSRTSSSRAQLMWWPWIFTAFAFPPAGLLSHAVVGNVDSVEAAVAAGVIAGAVIGTVQWLFLRTRGVPVTWIVGTAVGLAVGLTAGSAVVSYETTLGALAVMGLVSGVCVGLGQALSVRSGRNHTLAWSLSTGAL